MIRCVAAVGHAPATDDPVRGGGWSRAGNGSSRSGKHLVASLQLIGPFCATGVSGGASWCGDGRRTPCTTPQTPPGFPPRGHKHLPACLCPQIWSGSSVISGLVHGGLAREPVVAWVAERQLGLITAAQLHAAGVGRGSSNGGWRTGGCTPYPGRVPGWTRRSRPRRPRAGRGSRRRGRQFISHRSAAVLWGSGQGDRLERSRSRVVRRDCRLAGRTAGPPGRNDCAPRTAAQNAASPSPRRRGR